MLEQKRSEVEERTLASSEHGLRLPYESKRVGVATAQELSRQKEQLLQTEAKLDDINSKSGVPRVPACGAGRGLQRGRAMVLIVRQLYKREPHPVLC